MHMGHITNPDKEYRLLQQKLDSMPTGAPDSPTFQKILRLLFSEEDAQLARQIPSKPTSLNRIARSLDIPIDELHPKLTTLAQRGLLIDIQYKDKTYFMLPPVVIGFFEYTFMRMREDVPMKEVAALFDQYMQENDQFAKAVFQKNTQIGRALIQEETLPEGDHTEILDWERATHLIESASAHAVSECACRHKARHLDKACDNPDDVCLSLNTAATTLAHNGHAKLISKADAMDILKRSKELGLMQTGDNVQKNVSYICNCCSCCCGMLGAINDFGITGAIVTSNWIMAVDEDQCKGCGACIGKCPVNAIEMTHDNGEFKNLKKVICKEELCLGCGVCPSSCQFDALVMQPRSKRVFTPETVIDKTIAMALERGKLTELIFENPEKFSHKMMSRLIKAIEISPPYKAAMAIEPLKSAFLNKLVKSANKYS